MKVTIGEEGLTKTWQRNFPAHTECVHCKGNSRIGFVAHEGIDEDPKGAICSLHDTYGSDDLWLHDCCAVAVYFCKKCLRPTALYNQA